MKVKKKNTLKELREELNDTALTMLCARKLQIAKLTGLNFPSRGETLPRRLCCSGRYQNTYFKFIRMAKRLRQEQSERDHHHPAHFSLAVNYSLVLYGGQAFRI